MPKPIIHSYSFGESKEIINGQVVEDKAVKSEYNGKLLHVDKKDNNKFTHYVLKGKELKNLLRKKTSKLGLLERLNADYMQKGKHTRRISKGKYKQGKYKQGKYKHSKYKQGKYKHTKKRF